MNKQAQIIKMFDAISPTYDRLNHLLSFGVDHFWRKSAAKKLIKLFGKNELKIADVACGTGDMLGAWGKHSKNKATLIGVDPSVGMLDLGKKKFPHISFIEGEAGNLPFENNSQDIISITYGIRNVVDLQKASNEFYRVLKNGGRLMILEFTPNENAGILHRFIKWYLHTMIPLIGKMLSKNDDAYTYLPQSIASFLSTKKLCSLLENSGFVIEETKPQTFAISTRIIARK